MVFLDEYRIGGNITGESDVIVRAKWRKVVSWETERERLILRGRRKRRWLQKRFEDGENTPSMKQTPERRGEEIARNKKWREPQRTAVNTLYIPSAVLLSSRIFGNVATLYESERPCYLFSLAFHPFSMYRHAIYLGAILSKNKLVSIKRFSISHSAGHVLLKSVMKIRRRMRLSFGKLWNATDSA